jgi:Fic family protein
MTTPSFQHFDLQLVSPEFDSSLTDTVIELNHLRKLQLGGTTRPITFFQLKRIFHIMESLGSARIEGNRTTISEYVEQKIDGGSDHVERFTEIENVEKAMNYIEEAISDGAEITHQFIRELHQLTVGELAEEGDKTPGAYRTWEVKISQSEHLPPPQYTVTEYMAELLAFVNGDDSEKYDLIKIAIAHHRFTWIHPFGNGNGRVVRLLTYALLIKYGFNVKDGKLLNPTAVFCNDREKYYEMLSVADKGLESTTLDWCEYVLSGISEEITKINRLLDFDYLLDNILLPTIEFGLEKRFLSPLEAAALRVGVRMQIFQAPDLDGVFDGLTSRQKTHQIKKLKDNGFIKSTKPRGRTYYVSFMNNFLMRGLVITLEEQGFIPPIDD